MDNKIKIQKANDNIEILINELISFYKNEKGEECLYPKERFEDNNFCKNIGTCETCKNKYWFEKKMIMSAKYKV